jgi:hypothetical protein
MECSAGPSTTARGTLVVSCPRGLSAVDDEASDRGEVIGIFLRSINDRDGVSRRAVCP